MNCVSDAGILHIVKPDKCYQPDFDRCNDGFKHVTMNTLTISMKRYPEIESLSVKGLRLWFTTQFICLHFVIEYSWQFYQYSEFNRKALFSVSSLANSLAL